MKIENFPKSDMKESPFFMVFVEGENTPTYKHKSIESAENEAKRLAETLDKKAYVLCSVKSFEVSKFIVKDCRPMIDELPF
jgi:hypothetical protein